MEESQHTFQETHVTPEMASMWLENNNEGNRPPKPSVWKHYSRMMREGTWGGTNIVVFDKNQNLLDGQHRLRAVADCGIPQAFQIIRGADTVARNYLDTGKPRSASDSISMSGANKNQSAISAGLVLHHHWMQGAFTTEICSGRSNLAMKKIHASERNALVQRLYEKDPGACDLISQKAFRMRSKFPVINISALFAFLYRAKQKQMFEEALYFVESAVAGDGLPELDSRRLMVQSLMKISVSKLRNRKGPLILSLLVNFFNKRNTEVRYTLTKFKTCPDLLNFKI